MSLRTLVADDQTMMRGAFMTLLSLEPDIEVCGQAGNGRKVLEVLGGMACFQDSTPTGAAYIRPVDVVLLDVEMPVMDGIAACETVRMRFPGTRILMLTTFDRPSYVRHFLDAGASGFIVEDAPSEQFAEAVRRVNAGHGIIDPALAVETLSFGASPLMGHETEVLYCVTESGTLVDTVSEPGLSQGTVHNRVSPAMLKANAHTRAQAPRLATGKGWF